MYVVAGIVGLIIYFIPSYIAVRNDHRSKGWIILVNILLGFTVVGWIVALLWAVNTPKRIVGHN
ncbi:MAG: superinfection immunity protein [Clostridia bacterium]|nr:superinfection immunity protein [Clostridia bacterium]